MQMPTLGKSSPCKSLGSPNRVYVVMAGQGRSAGVVTACHPGEGFDKGWWGREPALGVGWDGGSTSVPAVGMSLATGTTYP